MRGGSFNVTPYWLCSANRYWGRSTVGVRLVARPAEVLDRVVRGGSFNYTPNWLRSAVRYESWPTVRYWSVGVRLVARRKP